MPERETGASAAEEALATSLESARSWCRNSLGRYVRGVTCEFNYDIFRLIIDDEQISDMCLDPKEEGLIRVSQKQLDSLKRQEVDPESIFVHEITEFIVDTDPSVYLQNCVPFPKFPHDVACIVENANRKERELKPWFHS